MFEAYSKNKYLSTGVVQWMLNNAWPSMIWHLYDYYLDAGAGYFAVKKACEPFHLQYSYDDQSVVIVNSTYRSVAGLHRTDRCAWHPLERVVQRNCSCQRNRRQLPTDFCPATQPQLRRGEDFLHPISLWPISPAALSAAISIGFPTPLLRSTGLRRNIRTLPRNATLIWPRSPTCHPPRSPPAPRSPVPRAAVRFNCIWITTRLRWPFRSEQPCAPHRAAWLRPFSGLTIGSNRSRRIYDASRLAAGRRAGHTGRRYRWLEHCSDHRDPLRSSLTNCPTRRNRFHRRESKANAKGGPTGI